MTDTTKLDLSRVNAELAYERRQTAHLQTVIDRLNAENRALLDAKEAAETERDEAMQAESDYRRKNLAVCRELDEARAATAAAWEAGRDAAADKITPVGIRNPANQYTEHMLKTLERIHAIPNPYAAKEAAHG